MTKTEVRARIEQFGIIPGIRVSAAGRARYAAEAVYRAGLPIAEVTMTVPGAIDVVSHLTRAIPDMIVGAGTALDVEAARRCLDTGARFLTGTGLVMEVVEFALKQDVVVFPGAFTPTEVIAAWKSGADFVKVFPCAPVGGPNYIRALKVPFPQVPLIATGGENQQTAGAFIQAGATALGIGAELIPSEALDEQKEEQIQGLARRFLTLVKDARNHEAGK
jgi:2-dehydro-3-deoxyphosphogluconate aldolase/(4S)-4-hydroxy-2-oxoglutarate aldolase